MTTNPTTFEIAVYESGIWLVNEGIVTNAQVQHAVVEFAERLGSIDRAAFVARLRAVADVVERSGPIQGVVAEI